MPCRNGLIAVSVKVAFFLAAVLSMYVLAGKPLTLELLSWPTAAVAGVLLSEGLRQSNIQRRRRAVQNQVECLLRARSGGVSDVPRSWKPGLATGASGRLDFQPRGRVSGGDEGELLTLWVDAVGRTRDITVTEGFFRMGPTWRVVELSTPEGSVELAGPVSELENAVSAL